MLQHWASEGEFYTGGFVLHIFIELVMFVLCVDIIVLNFNESVMFASVCGTVGPD